jgi:hypothetical protein
MYALNQQLAPGWQQDITENDGRSNLFRFLAATPTHWYALTSNPFPAGSARLLKAPKGWFELDAVWLRLLVTSSIMGPLCAGYPRRLMNWGHVVRNTAIAIGITFVTAVGVYLAIRLVVSAL